MGLSCSRVTPSRDPSLCGWKLTLDPITPCACLDHLLPLKPAPLPEFKHSLPLNHPYHTSNVPFCPSSQAYAAQDDYASPHSQTRPPTVSDEDPSPSPSSHYDSLPRTPPSLLNDPHAIASSSSSSNKRARRESSLNPYASTSAGSSYDGSPEPESMRVLGEDDELDFLMHEGGGDSKTGGAGANGKGKKRKQLPTTAEFQHPDVSGLSKKEARLVKNRAAAFLSRQRYASSSLSYLNTVMARIQVSPSR